VALQLAGKYAEADAALEQFTAAFPKSGLLADAAVRYAEDALLARHFEEAMKRFAAVGDQYAKTEQAHLATLGVAGTQYQMGHLDEAVKIASQIPEGERLGDLSAANYLIGDCLLRKAPREAGDDALATARLIQDLSDLSDRFKSFVLAHDGDPRMVDASLKMGYCQQRMASLMAEPMERRKPLAAARRMYMGLLRQFPDHPLYPIMVLESARCTSQFGSRMAENELARFQYEPLKNSRLAPVALVRLGQVMRNTRRTDAAVKMLTQARADHEGSLMKDPARSAWAAALRYELGMALKEGGKYAEAQEILQSVLRDFPSDPRAAEIPWRIAQCQREAAMEQLLPNRKLFGRRDTAEQARITLAAGLEQMRQVAKVMAAEAKAKSPEPELAAQIAYEAGGCWRTVADFEAESARMAAQEEAQKQKVRGKQRALAPATKPAATQPAAAPGHDSQKEARACYRTILEIAPDSATAAEARIALAELDQTGPARPLQLGRRRTSAVVVPTRTELPPVLNIDGNADFPKLEPFVRTASADLMDEETATLDDGLIDRTFSLPEEAIAIPAHQN
jgi:tetratricopeptide (TPR) repeat protein